MLSRFSPVSLLTFMSSRLNLEENLTISGPVEEIRNLAKQGTLIMTPTHVSNLDSIVIGLGLHMSRLPPFTYGAGLNLFDNPLVSFFLNNLGAYKVDRRKKNGVYKSALKQYAALSLEMGQHNLFFPGGGRDRRGGIERHLKLGLLGCGVNVYTSNLVAGKPRPQIFVIPCTLSYGLVLEARSLIEEHLQETGKSRYIRIRGDLNRPMRILNFWRNLQSMHSKIHVRFGEPLDLFGNRVNGDGVSLDAHGRPIDTRKYVEAGGHPVHSSQRDQEYTRELGRSLLTSFRRNNVVMSTHIAAFAIFQGLRLRHRQYDLYRLLRTLGPDNGITREEALVGITALLGRLLELESQGELLLEPTLYGARAEYILASALEHFRSFHDNEVLQQNGECVFTLNMKLLYYYRNRLDHYGLEDG